MSARQLELARVNNTELAFEVRGSGEPVVLIHGGIVADALALLLTEPALVPRYRLIHYHRRGYGQSARAQGAVSIAERAQDCLALMEHTDVSCAHVVGYSYGGTIALQLALDSPEAVQSLTLLDPLVPGVPMSEAGQQYFMGALNAAFAAYGGGDKAGAIDVWAKGALGRTTALSLSRRYPEPLSKLCRTPMSSLKLRGLPCSNRPFHEKTPTVSDSQPCPSTTEILDGRASRQPTICCWRGFPTSKLSLFRANRICSRW
jgi:pimeloyl-ACP methyl ester carboxylesterase